MFRIFRHYVPRTLVILGVGEAATRAVVASCVLILVGDYVLATLLFKVIFG